MPFDKYDESETIQHPSGTGWINQMRSGRKMVPRFQGEKDIYDTAEEADSMAAKRSQYEYDELRRDPKNQWYMPGTAAPPLLKNPGPSMHTPTEPQSMNPIDTIRSGLQALDMGKMSAEGFDVNAHHARMLSTGPFATATQRQSIWDRVNNPDLIQDHEQGPGYPDEGEGHAPAPIQIAQAGTGTPIGLGSNPNGKINALSKSTQAQLKAIDEDAAAPLRQSTSGAVMGREGVQYDKKANPILSADALEKDRVRRNAEMDVIEKKLRGVSPRPNETEDQRLRRMHPELY